MNRRLAYLLHLKTPLQSHVLAASGANTHLRTVSASGHKLPPDCLKRFGLALSTQAQHLTDSFKSMENEELSAGIQSLAIGSKDMGDEGMAALCEGLAVSYGGLLQSLDLALKNL